jgi:hypothetical protein
MVDKDAKVREMRRENLLLTSKIQLLEDQMENLNDRVDRTLRERHQLRRDISTVRFDSNLSIEVIDSVIDRDDVEFDQFIYRQVHVHLPVVHPVEHRIMLKQFPGQFQQFIIPNRLAFKMNEAVQQRNKLEQQMRKETITDVVSICLDLSFCCVVKADEFVVFIFLFQCRVEIEEQPTEDLFPPLVDRINQWIRL